MHNNSCTTSPARWLYRWLTAAFTLAAGKWRRWGGHARRLRSSSFLSVWSHTEVTHGAWCFPPSLEDAPVQQTSLISNLGRLAGNLKRHVLSLSAGLSALQMQPFIWMSQILQITLLSVPKFPALPSCTITTRFEKCGLVVFGAPFVVDLAEKWTAEEAETLCWTTAARITVYFTIAFL